MILVRFAKENDLDNVNILRKKVNELHVSGKPDVFKPGFPQELQDYIFEIWNDPEKKIVVAEQGDKIIGFAILHHIHKPETPYMFERRFLNIEEFGVDEAFRRQGTASEMIAFIKEYAAEKGYPRVELDMWEFNQSALAFYEAAGFSVYRRYMEMLL